MPSMCHLVFNGLKGAFDPNFLHEIIISGPIHMLSGIFLLGFHEYLEKMMLMHNCAF